MSRTDAIFSAIKAIVAVQKWFFMVMVSKSPSGNEAERVHQLILQAETHIEQAELERD